jgi:hypothetical protein
MEGADLTILRDPKADDDTRLHAVYQLRRAAEDWSNPPVWVDDDEVLDLLTHIAGDEDEGSIHNEATEALVQIWLSKGSIDATRFRKLSSYAKEIVQSYLEVNRPDLLDTLPP